MAHVAEEGRLRPIECGQALRALSLFFIGLGVGDACGNLARDKIQELLIERIEFPIGIERRDEHSDRLVLSLPRNGAQPRAKRRPVPASCRQIGKLLEEVFHDDGAIGTQNIANRPGCGFHSDINCGRRGRMIGVHAGSRNQIKLVSFFVEQVRERAGHVLLVRQPAFNGGEYVLL